MLQKLNERIQGIVAWVIISLIAITFALFGIDYYVQSRHASTAAVEINGQTITKQELELNYRRTRQMRDPAQMTAAVENNLKKQVLEDLTINHVSTQAARRYGFEINSAQANAAILNIPQFQEDGHFSADRYKQAISGALFTPESFKDEVRQGMLLNQQRFAFIGTAFALSNEVDRFVKLYLQTRDYKYLSLPLSRFIDTKSISDDDVASYYKTHQKEFLSPEKVALSYITLSMENIRKSISIPSEQIKQYYDANQNNYLTPAQWKVAHILIAVPANATEEIQRNARAKAEKAYEEIQAEPNLFDEKVKSLSDDKISVSKNGELPWIVAGQSELDEGLISLVKPGQISKPIKTRHGYEILKLLDQKPAKIKSFSSVKSDIKQQLITEKAQLEYAKALEQLSDLSYQSPDSLKPVAEELGLSIEHTNPFSKEGGNLKLTQNKEVINTAFSHDVLELKNNSEPVQLDNSVVVLRVKERIQAKEKPLLEVKSLIIDKLATAQAKRRAEALGEKLQQLINENKSITELLSQNNLLWKTIESASRDTDKAPAPINELAFNLPKAGATTGQIIGDKHYFLIQLTKVKDGELSQLDEEKKMNIIQQLETSYGIMDYDLYVSSLLNKAEIVHH